MKNLYLKTPRILILGIKGMLGRTVFSYFKKKYPQTTWGTYKKNGRNDLKMLLFDVNNHLKDFENIIKKIKKINYVINCIGIVGKDRDLEELFTVNSLFPHILEKYAKRYKFNLVHVSSDAVFPKLIGQVTENNNPSPEDAYGVSKMLGETTILRAITIRTSILGFDTYSHHGLLESISRSRKDIKGYVNQAWSGCTSLQFANLCEWIIANNNFSKIRKQSKVIHFAPLKSSKYEIVRNYISLLPTKYPLKKINSVKITRYLSSEYFDLNMLKMYNVNVQDALTELINFENEITGKK